MQNGAGRGHATQSQQALQQDTPRRPLAECAHERIETPIVHGGSSAGMSIWLEIVPEEER
jgi:hypothetical protein